MSTKASYNSYSIVSLLILIILNLLMQMLHCSWPCKIQMRRAIPLIKKTLKKFLINILLIFKLVRIILGVNFKNPSTLNLYFIDEKGKNPDLNPILRKCHIKYISTEERTHKHKLTMILPSILKSFCSNSQIWIRAFCKASKTNEETEISPMKKQTNLVKTPKGATKTYEGTP